MVESGSNFLALLLSHLLFSVLFLRPLKNIFFMIPDVSEEILSKYRNISQKPAGLMEDDQSDNATVKETEFDDDFKFEDAKRKLRIVLCMADRSNFPR